MLDQRNIDAPLTSPIHDPQESIFNKPDSGIIKVEEGPEQSQSDESIDEQLPSENSSESYQHPTTNDMGNQINEPDDYEANIITGSQSLESTITDGDKIDPSFMYAGQNLDSLVNDQ